MTERDFWMFLKGALARRRAAQTLGGIVDRNDSRLNTPGLDGHEVGEAVQYIGRHSFLPEGYDKMPIGEIISMGRLLLGEMASISTKEVILILLAHHPSKEALSILKAYNEQPGEKLRIFAQLALEECEVWNE